ncbi:MAG: polysaccharide biosynthesis C-terminal domain-containing protein [Bacteroidia bacterium]|nr:polysaccharide biosynthesis C-terminal domain-containing protein [Bacteroidia bacterium]MDW8158071.1 polysaccharide biosynthesis C-terminal domain-containing protein [Bacteroidia bacterium]
MIFYRQLLKIVLLNLLAKPLWLAVENWLQDKIGHASYGKFAALFSLSFLFTVLLEGGLAQTLARCPVQESTSSLTKDIFSLRILLGSCAMCLCLCAGYLLGYAPAEMELLFLLCIFHFGQSLVSILRALLQALHQFGKDAYASVGDKILFILGLPILLFCGINIYSFAIALLISTLLVLFWLGAITYAFWLPLHFSGFHSIKNILGKSIGLAIMALLFSCQERLSFVILERTSGSVESSLYAGAYRWYSAASMYLWTILPPFYARFAKEPQNQELFNIAQIIVSLPMILICTILFWYPDEVFFLFSHSNPAEIKVMTQALQILSIGLLSNSIFNVYSTYLSACNREKYINFLLLPAISINTLLTFIFAPMWGAIAGAIGLSTSLIFLSVGYAYYFAKKSNLQFPRTLIFQILLISSIAFGAAGISKNLEANCFFTLVLCTAILAGLVLGLGIHKTIVKFIKS